jgi:chromosome segregation ATPase
MTRPSPVTAESVAEAVAVLKAEGRRPTVRAIQAWIGGGSVSYIHAHVKRLEAAGGGPPVLSEHEKATARAVEAATRSLAATNAELGRKLAELESKLATATEGRTKAEERISWLTTTTDYQDGESRYVRKKIRELEERTRKDAEELGGLRAELAASRAMAESAMGEAESAMAELAEARREAKATGERLAQVERNMAMYKERYEGMRDALDPIGECVAGSRKVILDELRKLREHLRLMAEASRPPVA